MSAPVISNSARRSGVTLAALATILTLFFATKDCIRQQTLSVEIT
jgi:hypothetical protein